MAFVIDIGAGEAWQQFQTLRSELERFHPLLLEKPYFVILNKIDLGITDIDPEFAELKVPVIKTSAITGVGLDAVKQEAFKIVLAKGPKRPDW